MKITLILFYLVFLISCQQKKISEEEIRNQNIITEELAKQIQFDINVLIQEFDKNARRGGYLSADKKFLSQLNLVTSWKNKYLNKRTNENLIAYTDSILQISLKLKISSDWKEKSKIALQEITKYKINFKENPNETNHLQLFFWTLKAELDFLQYSSQFIGLNTAGYNRYIMGWADTNIIALGDTMFFIMEPSPAQEYFDKALIYRAGKTFYEHENTKSKTYINPVKIGQNFFFQIIPKQKGNYKLTGEMILDSLDTSTGRDCTMVMTYLFLVK